jgi:hypothetical protein
MGYNTTIYKADPVKLKPDTTSCRPIVKIYMQVAAISTGHCYEIYMIDMKVR